MKKTILFTALVAAMIVTVSAHAQGGGVDQPENPTLILAGLSSGVFAVGAIRTRIRARRHKANTENQ